LAVVTDVGRGAALAAGAGTAVKAVGRVVRALRPVPPPKVWNPLNGPGPLPERVVQNFRSATYTERVLREPLELRRDYSKPEFKLGAWWTPDELTPLQARIDLAILPEWGNTMKHVVRIRVPKGTKIYEGLAAPQEGYFGTLVGGGRQVYIDKKIIDKSWVVSDSRASRLLRAAGRITIYRAPEVGYDWYRRQVEP